MLPTVSTTNKLLFAEFPMKRSWQEIRESISTLRGATVILFVDSDYDTWLIFSYGGHEFSVNDHGSLLQFHVQDRDCPAHILVAISQHFRCLNDALSASWLREASDREATTSPRRTKRSDLLECRPRLVAELPFCVPWAAISEQLAKLSEIQITTVSNNAPDIWTSFFYQGEVFRLGGGGDMLLLSVDDPTCPDDVALKVIGYVMEILSDNTMDGSALQSTRGD